MYLETTLENGIRVVTDSMPAVRSVSIGVLVNAGSRDDPPGKGGLAHLVEHLMFQGTSSRDSLQIARLMDEAGGHTSAFTSRDYTCFTATVLGDYHTYALDLLGDILLNSIFPPEELERQKHTILREIDALRDRPEDRADAMLKAHVWANHSLGKPVIGRSDTVCDLTREDVIYFVHSRYMPDRIIVAAAGNIEHDDFVSHVRDAFWRLVGSSVPDADEPPVFGKGVTLETMGVAQAYFSLGIPALPYSHPDRYAMHVVNKLLGGGISSRLFRRIREDRGLVYHIGSEYHAYRDAGLLAVEGSTSPELFPQVLEQTLAELGRFFSGEEPINEEELWNAKKHLLGQHLIASENTDTRMGRLATQMFYFGSHISTNEIRKRIQAVDNAEVERLMASGLADEFQRTSIAVVGPGASDHCCRESIENLLY